MNENNKSIIDSIEGLNHGVFKMLTTVGNGVETMSMRVIINEAYDNLNEGAISPDIYKPLRDYIDSKDPAILGQRKIDAVPCVLTNSILHEVLSWGRVLKCNTSFDGAYFMHEVCLDIGDSRHLAPLLFNPVFEELLANHVIDFGVVKFDASYIENWGGFDSDEDEQRYFVVSSRRDAGYAMRGAINSEDSQLSQDEIQSLIPIINAKADECDKLWLQWASNPAYKITTIKISKVCISDNICFNPFQELTEYAEGDSSVRVCIPPDTKHKLLRSTYYPEEHLLIQRIEYDLTFYQIEYKGCRYHTMTRIKDLIE